VDDLRNNPGGREKGGIRVSLGKWRGEVVSKGGKHAKKVLQEKQTNEENKIVC